MNDDNALLDVDSWDRFVSRELAVEPSLLGASLQFDHNGRRVTVQLPRLEHLGDESKVTVGTRLLVDGIEVPHTYRVHSVDFTMITGLSMELPKAILERHPCAVDLVSKPQQETLFDLAGCAGEWASSAFGQWVRVVRWKTTDGTICRPEIHGSESGWSTYLHDHATGKKIWIGSTTIKVPGEARITEPIWREIERALQNNEEPPIHLELLFDAEDLLKTGQLNRCVVELAMACETFIKRRIADSLPESLTEGARRYVRRARVRGAGFQMFEETLIQNPEAWPDVRRGLDRLFEARNAVVHEGRNPALTADICRDFLASAKLLFAMS